MDRRPIPDHAALLVNHEILAVADLHIGLEENLREAGVTLPSRGERMADEIEGIAKQYGAARLVLAGDVKHFVPRMASQERRGGDRVFPGRPRSLGGARDGPQPPRRRLRRREGPPDNPALLDANPVPAAPQTVSEASPNRGRRPLTERTLRRDAGERHPGELPRTSLRPRNPPHGRGGNPPPRRHAPREAPGPPGRRGLPAAGRSAVARASLSGATGFGAAGRWSSGL